MAQNLFISMRVSDHAHLWLMPALLLLNSTNGNLLAEVMNREKR